MEHFRNDDAWTLSIAGLGGRVRLPDVGGDGLIDEIYRDVFFDELTATTGRLRSAAPSVDSQEEHLRSVPVVRHSFVR